MSDNVVTPEELKALIEQTYKVEEEYIALRGSYTQLQDTIEQVVEFLPNAIWIIENDGTIFLQNSKAKQLASLIETVRLDEDDYEVRLLERSYLIKTSDYKDKHLVSATDITEQKRKENLATMGQMAAHLSHEIRNPIGSIALLASTLLKRVIDSNKPIVHEIQKSVYRIDRIIKATLLFSKGVKTTIVPMRWSQLRSSVEEAIGYYSYSKPITFSFPQNDFILEGDLDLLNMLFTNFLFNAIDAIELDESDEGRIEITYAQDGAHHIFTFYDSGLPIEHPERLFEAFSSSKEKGNGLGLILSRQIAEAHGGTACLKKGLPKAFEVTLGRNDG